MKWKMIITKKSIKVKIERMNFCNTYFLWRAFLDSVNQTAALTMSGWKTPQKLAVENTQKCARTHVIEKLGSSSSSKCFLCKFRGKCGGGGKRTHNPRQSLQLKQKKKVLDIKKGQ